MPLLPILQSSFTFQYVSINTKKVRREVLRMDHFTFQYVSINTGAIQSNTAYWLGFTFQYVSINTFLKQQEYHE